MRRPIPTPRPIRALRTARVLVAFVVGTLALGALVLGAGGAGAQALPEAPPDTASVDERSPALAALLELVLPPTLGYAYAGNWTRGLLPAAVRIVGFLVYASDQADILEDPPCEAACLAGATMAVGGHLFAVFDAAHTAGRENEKRRRRAAGVSVAPTVGGAGVGLRVALPAPW